MQRITGKYSKTTTAGETVQAFVPNPLPPVPALRENSKISTKLYECVARLSELKVASHLVPSPDFFNYAFVRQEAILSSQIEGIQATLTDLLSYEIDPERETPDLLEVCNYLDALQYGRSQLFGKKGLPLSLRLIREMHKRLMRGVRGSSKQPGEFRSSQNWIGGSRPSNAHFVPPPPAEMLQCLASLEDYLHKNSLEHPLIRIGYIHVQFETIHPFLDGNGRLGRLLIALLLEAWGFLDARLLYLSLHFKRNQHEYYKRLDAVRQSGDWESWLEFFLDGISTIAQETIQTSQKLFRQFEEDRRNLLASKDVVISAVRLFELLPNHPVITVNKAVELLQTTKPTASKAIEVLRSNGILNQVCNVKRNRSFGYQKYLDLLKTDYS